MILSVTNYFDEEHAQVFRAKANGSQKSVEKMYYKNTAKAMAFSL